MAPTPNSRASLKELTRARPWPTVVWMTVVVLVASVLLYVLIWYFGLVEIGSSARGTYFVKDLLKDAADIGLKLGALIGGMLAAYKYLYQRYEPLVYLVSCGLITKDLVQDLKRECKAFSDLCPSKLDGDAGENEAYRKCHDLPIIVLHRSRMETLGIAEGKQVDLEFETPSGKKIWAIAYVFSFEATNNDKYADWPEGVSMSLRRFFRMERPFQEPTTPIPTPSQPPTLGGYPTAAASSTEATAALTGESSPPEGWTVVRVNRENLARFHRTDDGGRSLIWIAVSDYSVRFRDPTDKNRFYLQDDMTAGKGRVLEYVGISLRVLRRNLLRYRAAK